MPSRRRELRKLADIISVSLFDGGECRREIKWPSEWLAEGNSLSVPGSLPHLLVRRFKLTGWGSFLRI